MRALDSNLFVLSAEIEDVDDYRGRIPALRSAESISFCTPITCFIGENGSGKSTLAEAIAMAAGFNPEGGSKNFQFETVRREPESRRFVRLIIPRPNASRRLGRLTPPAVPAIIRPLMTTVRIRELAQHVGEKVTVNGWLYNKRTSGKLQFPIIRDGSGYLQCVVFRKEVSEDTWSSVESVTQESSVRVTGTVREEPRAPGGVELGVETFEILQLTPDYPITPKEHGTAFLMDLRHLWLRSSKQHAVLRIRNELEKAIRDFFYDRDFVLIDSPILTANAAEGTSTLFETDYFGEKAYLSQSGQLYLEPAAAAFGRVYCFGPTFRAEKSKTRRHLMEFWMIEPEVAFLEFEGLQDLAEEYIEYLVGRVLERCQEELKTLERDVTKLENVKRPFPRITYRDAIELLKKHGVEAKFGDDFGGDEETIIANSFDKPVMISRYPAAIKAFYMQPDPEDPSLALGLDMIAPEGYGEIIGGSQRIHDHDLLLQRIQEHNLPVEAFQWYLDVRKYGTFPHSGFGMGLERVVAWMSGVPHLRETIPYPRMLNRIYP